MDGITCQGILKVHKNFAIPRYLQCKLEGNYRSKNYQARSRDAVKQCDKYRVLNSGQNSPHRSYNGGKTNENLIYLIRRIEMKRKVNLSLCMPQRNIGGTG